MTVSAIYEGWVSHRRFAVREHGFRYGLALAYLDLDEVGSLLGGRLLSRRPGLVRFRRADYLGDPSTTLQAAVRAAVAGQTGAEPRGPIRLLTHLRTFGHCFNPVSFYYCFSPQEQLEAVVAEVNNTPWGERHAYVLPRTGEGPVLHGKFDKRLHVSPFMGMDQRYAWSVAVPGQTAGVHIENWEGAHRAFEATLALRRRPFTEANLRRITLRYPAATVRVLALIYAQALALKVKGVPVHRRPEMVG